MSAAAASGGVSHRLARKGSLVEGTYGTSRPVLTAAHKAAAAAGDAARVVAAASAKPKKQLSTIKGRAFDKVFILALVAALSYYETHFPQATYPQEAEEAKRLVRHVAERAALPGARPWRRSSLPTANPLNDGASQADVGDMMDSTDDDTAANAPASVPAFPTDTPAATPATPVMHWGTDGEGGAVRSQGEGWLPAGVPTTSQTAAASLVTSASEAAFSLAGDPDARLSFVDAVTTDWASVIEQMLMDGPGGPWFPPSFSLDGAAGATEEPLLQPPACWQAAHVEPLAGPSVSHAVTAAASATTMADATPVCVTRSATPVATSAPGITARAPSATSSASPTCDRMTPPPRSSCGRAACCCVRPHTAAVATEAAEAAEVGLAAAAAATATLGAEAAVLPMPPDRIRTAGTPADEAAWVLQPQACMACLYGSWDSITGRWKCCHESRMEVEPAGGVERQPAANTPGGSSVRGGSKVNDLSSTEAAMAG